MTNARHIETIESLWAVAHEWAHMLRGAFGEPARLASAGLSRRLALRCRNWLWSVEGLVRRLIVAAALAFDLSQLPPPRASRAVSERAARPAGPRLPGFRVFGFAAARGPRPHSGNATWSFEPYGHVPFPADTLLRIGAPQTRVQGGRAQGEASAALAKPRHHNPLRRRGRLSRYHPDYRPAEDRCDGDPLQAAVRDVPPPLRPRPSRVSPRPPAKSAVHPLPDLTDWRRVEDEWARVLPAPDLARRIAALMRVVEAPAAWVRRLARRLGGSNLAARLIANPPPELRRPKLDNTPSPPLLPELMQAHVLVALDTS